MCPMKNPGLGATKSIPKFTEAHKSEDMTCHFGFEPTSETYNILGIVWNLGND